MDGDDAVLRQEPLLLKLFLDVVKRIAVLGEDDYFFIRILGKELSQEISQPAQLAVLLLLNESFGICKQHSQGLDLVGAFRVYSLSLPSLNVTLNQLAIVVFHHFVAIVILQQTLDFGAAPVSVVLKPANRAVLNDTVDPP